MTIYSREVIDEEESQDNRGMWIAEMLDLSPLKIQGGIGAEGYKCDRCGVIFLHPSIRCDYCGDKKRLDEFGRAVVNHIGT